MSSGNTAHCCRQGMGKGKVLLAPVFCSTKIAHLEQGGALRNCARSDLRHFLLILPLCTWIEAGTSSHCTTIYYSHSNIRELNWIRSPVDLAKYKHNMCCSLWNKAAALSWTKWAKSREVEKGPGAFGVLSGKDCIEEWKERRKELKRRKKLQKRNGESSVYWEEIGYRELRT